MPFGAPGTAWWTGRWERGGLCLQGPQRDAQRFVAGKSAVDISAIFSSWLPPLTPGVPTTSSTENTEWAAHLA